MSYKSDTVDIITMGCSKNLIDSERLLKRLGSKGYKFRHNPENPNGEYVVVNTCGFIGDAKEESINMILNLIELKKKKKIGRIIVMGCLSERYRLELKKEIPGIYKWYGKFDWNEFVDSLPSITETPEIVPKQWERDLTTPPWSAYLKISEGCDRFCAFCAIPHITGRHTSRPMDEILDEARSLVEKGVKEFNIIAQDLSSYGKDLYGEQKLPELIDKIAEIKGVEWIRLHYLHPKEFPLALLDVMNRHNNVCKYLDIALQHIADNVLDNMNRKISKSETLELIQEMRKRVPNLHLRTTVMTGFPGEGDKEFEELKEFVKTQKFERLGGFAYCEEEDTLAAKKFADDVDSDVKEQRLSEIMQIQQEISEEFNQSKIGQILKVLVEENFEGYSVGRTEFDSPEVDQEVIINECEAAPGSFIEVKITGCAPFELYGKEVKNEYK